MSRLIGIALLVAACSGAAAPTGSPGEWWLRDVPDGFVVVYHADHGLGICDGFQSCPTRIIQRTGSDSFCITETDRDGTWEFREQNRCP